MERLTLNRRQKTTGDRVDYIPDGDVWPVWTKISLDAKLPIMSYPKGSVVFFTTKLGEPKHKCKQEYDFDLRDPNGKYVSNEYKPLHDPHLRSHFNTNLMRRDLMKKGFISQDDKVLCSLKEFNQYRQYLRHVCFLEIAKERREELENILARTNGKAEFQKKPSHCTIVRRRFQQQNERDRNRLRMSMDKKSASLEKRLREIRDEMTKRERKQREDAERRQATFLKNQQKNEQRKTMVINRLHKRDTTKQRLFEDRETEAKIRAELKCMEKWNARKEAQREMLKTHDKFLKDDDEEMEKNIFKREQVTARKWGHFDKKMEMLKQKSREDKHKRDVNYFKRLDKKLASGDYKIYSRRKERRRSPKKRFSSAWKLLDVLSTFEVPEYQYRRDNPALDGTVTKPDKPDDTQIRHQACIIVQDVISKVKNDIYPQYLQMLDEDMKGENEALRSKSVRFSSDEEEIKTDLPSVNMVSSVESLTKESVRFKPVSEHVLTPCASQLEVTKLEAGAILGSPEVADKRSSVSFVETLLLRLLDDLNCGRLSKEDIMKLASYSMDIIQSAEIDTDKQDVIVEVPEESKSEGPYLASSSSSIIAKKMVDFTLDKILRSIQNGNVNFDDLASLTVSFMENIASGESSTHVSQSDAELDAFIEETIQRASTTATDSIENSPVCEALLDDFMVVTLKSLTKDLEEEVLTKKQVHALAVSVIEEARHIILSESDVTNRDDLQRVLQDFLRELQSGAIDSHTIYQVVSAIVYSYNTIKTPLDAFNSNEIKDLLKEVFSVVERKAGDFEDVNLHIVQEANLRLLKSDLDSKLVKDLSASVASVIIKPEICSTVHANTMVKEALIIAKDKMENEESDADLRQSVMEVAEAVINTLTDSQSRESQVVDVFLDVLKNVRIIIDNMGGFQNLSVGDIDHLIEQISSNAISEEGILEMAMTVARVVKSPIQSDSSLTPSLAVKDCLQVALNDIIDCSIENAFLSDMIGALKTCCTAADFRTRKTPAFLRSLARFLRNVLDHLIYRIQTDEDAEDIAELSLMKNAPNETKPETADQQVQKQLDSTYATQMLNFIHEFVDAVEKEGLTSADAKEVGHKLIDFGKRLVGVFTENSGILTSSSTESFVDDVVEEIIRKLQIEISSGMLSNDSLKEMTKGIIDATSASDVASEAVDRALRGIYRDFERGYRPSDLRSVPTLADSPSASTVASQVVKQTIESIKRDISQRRIPREMIISLASSVVTALSGDERSNDNLTRELTRHRPTITNIIDCMKKDQVSQIYAEEMFCLILEHYKACVLFHKYQKEDNLEEGDIDLVSNLIMETLHNIERSIANGKINEKTFSIPSLQQSEDTSVVDSCLQNIRKDVAAEMKLSAQSKHDLIDFILDILTRLQMELADGTISNLSMAHFFQAICDEETDMRTLEMNASNNLTKVVENIKRFRGRSEYVHRILETYLIPGKTSGEVFGDPLKAIECILVNVSSEILSKFVKATLQTILMGMREEADHVHKRSPSAYVLRSASSIIAENVIKEVIKRINTDMVKKVHKIHGTVRKQDIERAARRLPSESPRETTKRSTSAAINTKQSISPVLSKEIEDIVLETLHNIISNQRLEQSIKSQKGSKCSSDPNVSQEIEDFVLSTLQNIVVDHQDRRSQMDMGVTRSGSKYAASSFEVVSVESKEATAYVNEVLQNVLAEMKAEIGDGIDGTLEKSSDADSANIQTLILEYLQTALNDTNGPEILEKALELFSPDDVKNVLIETISGTIYSIKENRQSQFDLTLLYEAAKRFFDETDPENELNVCENVTPELIIDLLQQVKIKIESMEIPRKTLDNVSSQLATLGMTVTSETPLSENVRSVSSVASSLLSDLIKDVLTRISEQLSLGPDDKDGEITNKAEENTNNNDKAVSKSSSKASDIRKDVNCNRKISVSTANSCTSVITSDTNTSNDEHKCSKNGNASSENLILLRKAVNEKCFPLQERKLLRRSTESRPVIGQSNATSKTDPASKKDSSMSYKLTIPQQPDYFRQRKLVCYTEKTTLKDTKRLSTESSPKRFVKASLSEKEATSKKTFTPIFSSSAHTRNPIGSEKTLGKINKKGKTVKNNTKQNNNETHNEECLPPVREVREDLLELTSLCGVHKTRISYREQQDDNSTNNI